MNLKLKDGIIAKMLCTIIERTLKRKYGVRLSINVEDLMIVESEETGMSDVRIKANATVETKELNNVILSLVK